MNREATISQTVSSVDGIGPVPRRSAGARRLLRSRRDVLVVWGLAIALLVVNAIVVPGVFTIGNLNNQTAASLALIVVAAGQTIVVLTGGIDLSVGGVVAVSTCLAATRMGDDLASSWYWLPIIVLVGLAAGLVNGVLVAYRGLQSFVATMATWSIFNGIALLILPEEGGSVPSGLVDGFNSYVGPVGIPVLCVLALALTWVWFRSSRWGTRIAAVGSNPRSAYMSGTPLRRTLVLAYALSGALAAVGGIILTTQTSVGSPLFGSEYVLNSIAAVVLGGVSLAGGRGSFIGVIGGAYLILVISSLTLGLGLESYWQQVATGVLLVVAVWANTFTNQRGRSRS